MSRYVDSHLLRFHKPAGMSYSHYRNVVRNRVHQENLRLCGKPMGYHYESWCCRSKGHQGECDDIPF